MVFNLADLEKGEAADLGNPDAGGVSVLRVGAGWDRSTAGGGRFMGALNKKKGGDLDLVAIAMNGSEPVRFAGFENLDPLKNGNLTHSGDNMTGEGEGDDETVTAKLDSIANSGQPVNGILFAVMAFKKGNDFKKVENIDINVYDASGGSTEQVANYWPSLRGNGNAIAVCKVVKNKSTGAWGLTVINEMGSVQQGNFDSVLDFAASHWGL